MVFICRVSIKENSKLTSNGNVFRQKTTVNVMSPERQGARMSKITNDGLTRSGTGCFIAVPIWQQ